jgi:spermidine synthase
MWASHTTVRTVISAVSVCLAFAVIQFSWWTSQGRSFEPGRIVQAYYGPGGVVEIDANGDLSWDGLWHSSLAENDNYVGTNNWQLAVLPLLCHNHAGEQPLETCVIGLGTGITVGTLAETVLVKSVDSYEINNELQQLIRDYPQGTLHVFGHPKVQHLWQDGRSGLALNETSYDLITQQPLYLKQAGSSLLLSREYMELVKNRLKPNGVFCIYCNALGNPKQAQLVRATAASVFAYCESFGNGYMIVASDTPFRYDTAALRRRIGTDPALEGHCQSYGLHRLDAAYDTPRLSWDSPFIVTDNHPLVEYPLILRAVLGERTP